jgi:hypothetical protein
MSNRNEYRTEAIKFCDFIIKESRVVEKDFKTIQEHIDYRYKEVKERGEVTIAALKKNSRSDDEQAIIQGMLNDIYAMYRPLKGFSTGPIQICKDLQKSATAIKEYLNTNNNTKNVRKHGFNIPNMKERYDSVLKLQEDFYEEYKAFYSAMAPTYVKIRKIHHTTTNGAADKLAINEITRLEQLALNKITRSEQLASIPEGNGNNEKTNSGGTRRRKHHTKRSKRSRRNKY